MEMPGNAKKKPGCAALGCGLVLLLAIAVLFLPKGCGKKEDPSALSSWARGEVTEKTVKAVLKDAPEKLSVVRDLSFPESITEIHTVDVASKGAGHRNVVIFFKTSAINETALLEEVGGTFIFASSVLYGNPKVETVSLRALAEMRDQYGKTKDEVVARLGLSREIAGQIDWEGLALRHSSDPGNIYRIATDYYVHPAVLANADRDRIRL